VSDCLAGVASDVVSERSECVVSKRSERSERVVFSDRSKRVVVRECNECVVSKRVVSERSECCC